MTLETLGGGVAVVLLVLVVVKAFEVSLSRGSGPFGRLLNWSIGLLFVVFIVMSVVRFVELAAPDIPPTPGPNPPRPGS